MEPGKRENDEVCSSLLPQSLDIQGIY